MCACVFWFVSARTARHDHDLIAWIIGAARRSRRISTVCTGAFIAAEAGLLDGRTVVSLDGLHNDKNPRIETTKLSVGEHEIRLRVVRQLRV